MPLGGWGLGAFFWFSPPLDLPIGDATELGHWGHPCSSVQGNKKIKWGVQNCGNKGYWISDAGEREGRWADIDMEMFVTPCGNHRGEVQREGSQIGSHRDVLGENDLVRIWEKLACPLSHGGPTWGGHTGGFSFLYPEAFWGTMGLIQRATRRNLSTLGNGGLRKLNLMGIRDPVKVFQRRTGVGGGIYNTSSP